MCRWEQLGQRQRKANLTTTRQWQEVRTKIKQEPKTSYIDLPWCRDPNTDERLLTTGWIHYNLFRCDNNHNDSSTWNPLFEDLFMVYKYGPPGHEAIFHLFWLPLFRRAAPQCILGIKGLSVVTVIPSVMNPLKKHPHHTHDHTEMTR